MKHLALVLGLATAFVSVGGCKKQASENEAIRAGIQQHLNGVATLNKGAMDMNIRSVSINGDQAHAEVEFLPKSGGTPGSGMQVAYNLEKRDGAWVVMKTQPLGGMQHPDPGQNPVHSGTPNFSDILKPAPGALPSGHPQVGSQPGSAQPSTGDQTPTKKPQ